MQKESRVLNDDEIAETFRKLNIKITANLILVARGAISGKLKYACKKNDKYFWAFGNNCTHLDCWSELC
jgi:hypothetical protein